MHPEFEAQFLDWIHPIGPDFFVGKRVLDAGCGIGRHAYFAASYGAREVVALDLSGAVESARRNLARFENVHVVQGDLLRPPFRTAADGGGFDFVYSIGVLHHLPDPGGGFQSLLRFVRPGGKIAVWVYGHENNGIVRNVVEPVRRVSTRIPSPALRAVAWPLALGFHGVAKGIYRPLDGTAVGRALPLHQYMASVGDFSFRQNYGIVFDQLSAPTAAYIKGEELASWFSENGLEDVTISHRHGNSWRGQGRVPAA
jgi:SAM-dependent methyltransferase